MSAVAAVLEEDPMDGRVSLKDLVSEPVASMLEDGRVSLKGMSVGQVEDLVLRLGFRRERAFALLRHMYGDGRLVSSLDQTKALPHHDAASARGTAAGTAATGAAAGAESVEGGGGMPVERVTKAGVAEPLGRALREALEAVCSVSGGLTFDSAHVARDGTTKLLSRLSSGPAKGSAVESVIIPMEQGGTRLRRYTLCVSSQVGCAQNCSFCMTGRMGLLGNLNAAQIVEQVVIARRYLEEIGDASPLSSVVFMGMGEPFHNMDHVCKAVSILTDARGGPRLKAGRVMVSTVGLVPELRRFCSSFPKVQVAVSLHATTDEVRAAMMPINDRYPLATLIGALEEHFPRPQQQQEGSEEQGHEGEGEGEEEGGGRKRRRRRHVCIEYTLMKGVNDSAEDATRLLLLLRKVHCIVNLITFNPHEGTLFQRCSDDASLAFKDRLRAGGRLATFRPSRGEDGMSACGQLGSLDEVQRAGRVPLREAPPPPSSSSPS